MKALYIHIPFCRKVCTYCDFYKMVSKNSLKEKYVEYLIKELEMKKDYLNEIETIYIGGGTPSSLDLQLLTKLFESLKNNIDFKNIKEFTIELNPIDVTEDLSKLLKSYNINRVSLGIQSLNKKKLKFLGRDHNKKIIKKSILLLQNAGIDNINADIIFGTPKDNFRVVKRDLKKLIRLNITHFSTYSLQLEKKTILYKLYLENKFKPIDEDLDSDIYKNICEYLKENKFVQYEVSNFSKNDEFKSIHNLTYWNNEKYLGIGAAASYYIGDTRYTNINNLDKYFAGIDNNKLNYLEENELVLSEMMFEEVMLGLRKLEGINLNNFKEKFNIDLLDKYPITNKLINKNDLVIKDGYLKVADGKTFILNSILLNYLDEDLDKPQESNDVNE